MGDFISQNFNRFIFYFKKLHPMYQMSPREEGGPRTERTRETSTHRIFQIYAVGQNQCRFPSGLAVLLSLLSLLFSLFSSPVGCALLSLKITYSAHSSPHRSAHSTTYKNKKQQKFWDFRFISVPNLCNCTTKLTAKKYREQRGPHK